MDPTAHAAVSVVLAARDESSRIGPAVLALVTHLETMGGPWEVVFADAGSRDATPSVVERLGRAGLRVIRTDTRHVSAAARLGVLAAIGPIVVVVDRDLAQPIAEIAPLVDAIDPGGFDLAVATLVDHGAQHGLYRFRALGHGTHGSLAGFVAFRRETGVRLLLREDASAHASDLVQRAERRGLRVAAVPVHEGTRADHRATRWWRVDELWPSPRSA